MLTNSLKPLSQGKFPWQDSTVGMTQTKHKTAKKDIHTCHILTQIVTKLKLTCVLGKEWP